MYHLFLLYSDLPCHVSRGFVAYHFEGVSRLCAPNTHGCGQRGDRLDPRDDRINGSFTSPAKVAIGI